MWFWKSKEERLAINKEKQLIKKDGHLMTVLCHNPSLFRSVVDGKNSNQVYWALYNAHFSTIINCEDEKEYVRNIFRSIEYIENDKVAGVASTICTDLAQNCTDDEEFFRWTIDIDRKMQTAREEKLAREKVESKIVNVLD